MSIEGDYMHSLKNLREMRAFDFALGSIVHKPNQRKSSPHSRVILDFKAGKVFITELRTGKGPK
jgi:hypothetical protein